RRPARSHLFGHRPAAERSAWAVARIKASYRQSKSHRLRARHSAKRGARRQHSLVGARRFCALARTGKGGDDAVQGTQLLLGALRPLKQAPQIAYHARAALAVAEKAVPDQLLLEVGEEIQQLVLGGRAAAAPAQRLRRRSGGRCEPL